MSFQQSEMRQTSGVLVQELTVSDGPTEWGKPRNTAQPRASDLASHHGNERRSARRYPCHQAVECDPLSAREQKPWPAEVNNISASGIALVLERRFEPGSVLTVAPANQAEIVDSLMARVVWVRAYGPGRWIVGCQLACRLADEDLRQFLAAWGVKPLGRGGGS